MAKKEMVDDNSASEQNKIREFCSGLLTHISRTIDQKCPDREMVGP